MAVPLVISAKESSAGIASARDGLTPLFGEGGMASPMYLPPKQIVIFFLVTYALSWFGMVGNWLWPSDAWPVPILPLGPLLAAPIMLWWFGGGAAVREWGRRMLRFAAPTWVYAVAFLVPLSLIMGSVGFALMLGVDSLPLPSVGLASLLIGIPLVALDGPAPEEPGFRGFAQHELQRRMSPLRASLWIGGGVLIWHLPVLVLGQIPLPIAIAIPAVSVLYAWLYIQGGSIWPLVGAHWVQNFFGGQYFGQIFKFEDSQIWTGALAFGYVGCAALVIWRYGPSLGRKA
ncbi:MAG: hypothetical protein JWS10_467 [Cypionkella sp.]|uniref:CPBP family intramembrane glutamic endopeptidase n=1 Tax=Cypionkella sp. TaxID=2811411 RepID=UPI0026201DEC|nr:type II CAAX endopeptidase family protein [Cypionkella sp.]MDB5657852.1 hypothetical protein [Cypionkella sp.]